MTEPRLPVPVEPKAEAEQAGLVDRLMERLTDYINEVDEQAAAERVAALRQKQPNASVEDLADGLIRRKCFRAGAVGAVTSGAALVPGLGTFASLTFGVAADIGMTFKLQAELVLEIGSRKKVHESLGNGCITKIKGIRSVTYTVTGQL